VPPGRSHKDSLLALADAFNQHDAAKLEALYAVGRSRDEHAVYEWKKGKIVTMTSYDWVPTGR
jgi:hypothetical protein